MSPPNPHPGEVVPPVAQIPGKQLKQPVQVGLLGGQPTTTQYEHPGLVEKTFCANPPPAPPVVLPQVGWPPGPIAEALIQVTPGGVVKVPVFPITTLFLKTGGSINVGVEYLAIFIFLMRFLQIHKQQQKRWLLTNKQQEL
jgi:hypothetical protein